MYRLRKMHGNSVTGLRVTGLLHAIGVAAAGAGHAPRDQLVATAVDHGSGSAVDHRSGSVAASGTVPAAVLNVLPPGILQTVEVVTAAELAPAVTEGESLGSERNEVNENDPRVEVAAGSGGQAVGNASAVRV